MPLIQLVNDKGEPIKDVGVIELPGKPEVGAVIEAGAEKYEVIQGPQIFRRMVDPSTVSYTGFGLVIRVKRVGDSDPVKQVPQNVGGKNNRVRG